VGAVVAGGAGPHAHRRGRVMARPVTELDVLRFIAASVREPAPVGDVETARHLAVIKSREAYALVRDFLKSEDFGADISASGGIVPRESQR